MAGAGAPPGRGGGAIIYLSAGLTQTLLSNPRADVGLMLNPANGQGRGGELEHLAWAADNGRYARPAAWEAGAWLEWLAGMRRWRQTCLFAVAPDVVSDPEATLALGLPFLPTIRQLGYKAAFAAQDGLQVSDVPWDAIDVLFVGGSTTWKLSEDAFALCREAHRRGLWTHMGRVNSLQRLRHAVVGQLDSVDGSHIAFEPDVALPRIWSWLDKLRGQRSLAAVGW